MPNVDDHGLEVLKKAARNIGDKPKKDYALQMIIVADESEGGGAIASTPTIQNINIANADTEVEFTLPVNYKSFIMRPRRNARLRLAYALGETNVEWITIPLGGYWVEDKKLAVEKLYIQSNVPNTILEFVFYA